MSASDQTQAWQTLCPACAAPVSETASYCPKCNTPLITPPQEVASFAFTKPKSLTAEFKHIWIRAKTSITVAATALLSMFVFVALFLWRRSVLPEDTWYPELVYWGIGLSAFYLVFLATMIYLIQKLQAIAYEDAAAQNRWMPTVWKIRLTPKERWACALKINGLAAIAFILLILPLILWWVPTLTHDVSRVLGGPLPALIIYYVVALPTSLTLLGASVKILRRYRDQSEHRI